MIDFSNLIGIETIRTLEYRESEPESKSIKATPKITRVPKDELENCYLFDPITFNSINKHCQAIMSTRHELVARDEKVKSYFDNFLESIGRVGDDLTDDELIWNIFQHQMIYGEAWVETVFNKEETSIVDLVTIDPKRMDYLKDAMDNILLDKHGKPYGYVLEVPYGIETEGKGDDLPAEIKKEVSVGTQKIFLLPKRIAHFKLYTCGDGFYGIGLIEPGYKSTLRKQNIEEAQTNSIYARGTYPLIDYVGDENHYPTPQMIQNAAKKLSEISHSRYLAFPNWHRVVPLEVKQSEIVDKTIDLLRQNQAASLGMPLAFATGMGESTNRATLSNQQKFLEFTLNDVVKRTIASFRKYIFRRICNLEHFKEVPYYKWGNINAEEVNEKAKRLTEYVRRGILRPEEDVRNFALESEQLK